MVHSVSGCMQSVQVKTARLPTFTLTRQQTDQHYNAVFSDLSRGRITSYLVDPARKGMCICKCGGLFAHSKCSHAKLETKFTVSLRKRIQLLVPPNHLQELSPWTPAGLCISLHRQFLDLHLNNAKH